MVRVNAARVYAKAGQPKKFLFVLRVQLIDTLIATEGIVASGIIQVQTVTNWAPPLKKPVISRESAPKLDCSSSEQFLRPLRSKLIKCHFKVGSDPLWAWVCSRLDPWDAFKELIKCVSAQSWPGGGISSCAPFHIAIPFWECITRIAFA